MANVVYFEIVIKGSKPSIEKIVNGVNYTECFNNKVKLKDGNYYGYFSGECKDDLDYTTLQSVSTEENSEVESITYFEDNDSLVHRFIRNGELILEEEMGLYDAKGAKYNDDSDSYSFNKSFSLGTKMEAPRSIFTGLTIEEKNTVENNEKNYVIVDGELVKYKGKAGTVRIPDSVRRIAGTPFTNNRKIAKIIIPNSVVLIDRYAFDGCINLEQVVFEGETPEIKETAFDTCKKLINHDFLIIGGVLCKYCGNKRNVIVPDGVTIINYSSFEGLADIESIQLPDSTKKINRGAFVMCPNLKHVNFSSNMEVDEQAIQGCDGLADDEGRLIVNDIYIKYVGNNSEETIPDTIRGIAPYAFQTNYHGCPSIKRIVISENVERVGMNAFEGCSNLSEVSIPSTINELGKYAFAKTQIKKIIIPKGVTKIPRFCFSNCTELEEVYLPEGLQVIEDNAFDNCEKLQKINIPETVQKIGNFAFKNCKSLSALSIKFERVSMGEGVFLGSLN